jgi:hypothetical protein
MLIDHVGVVFFPDVVAFRIIGRLAFPLFAYQVAIGLNHTSDTGHYFVRLFYFGLLAQIPFMVLFHTTELNVLFTFSFAVLLVHLFDKTGLENVFLFLACFFSVFSLYFSPGLNYGIFGVSTVLIFYIFQRNFSKFTGQILLSIFFVFSTYFFSICEFGILHLFGLIAIPFFFIQDIKFNINKYFYYFFYPVHLSFLLFLRLFLQ